MAIVKAAFMVFVFFLITTIINLDLYPVQGTQDSTGMLDKIRKVISGFISDQDDGSNSLSDANSSSANLSRLNTVQSNNTNNTINNINDLDEIFSNTSVANHTNIDNSNGSREFILTINPGASDSNSQTPISPANITIPVGATVVWMNKDSIHHQIVSGTPENGPTNEFYGDFFGAGDSYNRTLFEPGIIEYYDPIWTNIRGHIAVASEERISLGNESSPTNDDLSILVNARDTNSSDHIDIALLNTTTNVADRIAIDKLQPFESSTSSSQGDVSFNTSEANNFIPPLFEGSSSIDDPSTTDFGISNSPGFRMDDEQMNNPLLDQVSQFSQNQTEPLISPHEDTNSFIANGKINSMIVTASSDWIANGDWSIIVDDGEIINFTTSMGWFNGTNSHSHEFINFETDDEITLPVDNILTMEGQMDVGSNGVVTWENVESEITIGGGGKTITISVDHDDTDHHFAGQLVTGTTKYLSPCSDDPGPNMVLLPRCN